MITESLLGAYVLGPDEGERTSWNTGEMTIKTRVSTQDVVELTLQRGAEPPLHVHEHEDQWMQVLEGEMTVFVGEEMLPAGPGAFVWLPRQVPHTFVLASDELRVLAGATRRGFFHVVQELVEAFCGEIPQPMLPEHQQVLASVFARYDVRVVGPNPGNAGPGQIPLRVSAQGAEPA